MTNSEQFLTITGVWTSDDRLTLEPGYITTSHEGASHGVLEPIYRLLVIELLDPQGELVARQPVATAPLCDPFTEGRTDLFVSDKIRFPEETRTIRFIRGDTDTVIHEIIRSNGDPLLRLEWEPPTGTVDGRHVFSWTAGHPDDRPLQFATFYSHDQRESWLPLTLPSEATEVELDFDQLPGGEDCRVRVLATDGVNTVEEQSRPFRVAPKAYRAMILAPEDGAVVPAEQDLWLYGQGYHLEEQQPELEELAWTSSIDGELGRGYVIEVRLSRGRHDIALKVGEHSTAISLDVV
jgi:hypothetical protein